MFCNEFDNYKKDLPWWGSVKAWVWTWGLDPLSLAAQICALYDVPAAKLFTYKIIFNRKLYYWV